MYEDVARKVANSVRAMVPGVFTTRLATPATHRYIAWRRYAAATRPLLTRGFRHLADLEVTSLTVDPGMARPPVMRILLSEDGETVVAVYRLALRWTRAGIIARLSGGSRMLLDVVTHFADGTVVETSTAQQASVWTAPPYLYRDYLPPAQGLDAILARHRERLARHVQAAPGRTVVRYDGLDSILAAENESERRKREHRISIGWVTEAELARLSRMEGEPLAQLVAAVRQALASTEQPAPDQRAA